ncbi:MAG: hypothetical protein C5B55_03000 [Blastocatellia bacterium]|nr:MAG: hypothetical protein C5B55_03000 [Blastocatellia bacterium]
MTAFRTATRTVLAFLCLLALASIVNAQMTENTESTRSQKDMSILSCAGYIRFERLQSSGEIVGAEGEPERHTFTEGNVVFLNVGANQGIKEGQQFSIIRPRGDVKGVHKQKSGYLGTYVQELGHLQVFKVREQTSLAQITFSCDSILLGDLIAPIRERKPLPPVTGELDRFAEPTGKKNGRLMMAHDAHEMLTRNDVVYIDLGSEDGVKPGDVLTIYRELGTGTVTFVDNEESARGRSYGFQSDSYRGGGFGLQAQRAKDSTRFVNSPGRYSHNPITTREIKRHRPLMPRKILGEMVIIDLQTRTATAVITKAISDVHTGDWVELR